MSATTRSIARPATQTLTRRTVRPIARGESLTISPATCSPILCPAPAAWRCRSGHRPRSTRRRLLKALDRYPFGCSEQITSRALPLLYVNELATEAHLSLDTAIDQRIKDAIERLLARQGSNGSFGLWSVGGDDPWLDSYVTDFLTRAREKNFAVPDGGFKLALDRLRNFVANAPDPSKERRQSISPTRSMCWRAMASRRSATCVTSPTPSSTTSRRRSPRRRSRPRSACSAIVRAPSASMRPRWRRSRRRRGSSTAAPTMARCCAIPRRW